MRVKKTTANGTTLYGWDNDRIFAEYDESGNPIQETVYLGATPIAILKNTRDVFHIYTDQTSAPIVITDEENKELWYWDYEPFGATLPNEDFNSDGKNFEYNLRFPGQWSDNQTGLFYNQWRSYQPSLGRYIQSDPSGLKGGSNTFAYAANNPVMFVDNTGLKFRLAYQRYNIVIRTSIVIFGASSTSRGQQLWHNWYKAIKHYWGSGRARYTGTKFPALRNRTISLDIVMAYDSNATSRWNAIPADNAVQVMPNNWNNGRSRVIGGTFGQWNNNDSWNTTGHEFGHMLNLRDHYPRANGRGVCPGYSTRDLMASPWTTSSPSQREFNNIIEGDSTRQCP